LTIAAACRYALTGVGAAIAAGSHGWNGTWADFVTAPSRTSSRATGTTPPDGVYEVDVVAQKPATADATPTPVEVQGGWSQYTDGRVKGLKFISKTNEVVAMLPEPGLELLQDAQAHLQWLRGALDDLRENNRKSIHTVNF